ncbi:MAG: sugar transferase [Candidatus Dojkabacteria bacterium]|jgi:exopolysaccharide production protein ExoY
MPYIVIKRLFDVILAFVLLIIFSPLLLLTALSIWLYDGGPVFVENPKRIGKGGNKFFMYKFRSMIVDAHNKIEKDEAYKSKKIAKMKNCNKISSNDRELVTSVGRVIRKIDLDELPQLINVLKGEMSIVGPRPSYEDELKIHFSKFPKDRKLLKNIWKVKPGITGIWQVSGRNDIKLHDRFKMESEYSKKQNLITDMKILLKTPYVVFTRKGAYE